MCHILNYQNIDALTPVYNPPGNFSNPMKTSQPPPPPLKTSQPHSKKSQALPKKS